MFKSLSVLALVVALVPTTVLHASQAANAPQAGTTAPVTVEVTTSGLERTPAPVVLQLIRIDPTRPVTPQDIALAAKRLDLLPASAGTQLKYTAAGRRSTLVAQVDERPRYPVQVPSLIAIGSRLLFSEELVADFGNLFNTGDIVGASWRWSSGRPRVQLNAATPVPAWLPGIVWFDGLWEKGTYRGQRDPVLEDLVETRQQAVVSLEDWASPWLRWRAGGGYDRFQSDEFFTMSGTLELRGARDHLALVTDVGVWTAGTPEGFGSISTYVTARTTLIPEAKGLMVRVGGIGVSDNAPLPLWPGGGITNGRGLLLRAHQLHVDGVVTGEVFGRSVIFGTAEYQRPVRELARGTVALVAFTDIARATRRLGSDDPSRVLTDIGVGGRLYFPGKRGSIRGDLAYGVRDQKYHASASVFLAWPRQ